MVKSQGQTVVPVAFSGIAASLLEGGTTLHNRFQLPFSCIVTSSSRIQPNSEMAKELTDAVLTICDEAPTMSIHILHCVDRLYRDITNIDAPFGGKCFVLSGDFRQTIPFAPLSQTLVSLTLYLKKSPLWRFFKQFYLGENMRVLAEEVEFARFLLEIGEGRTPTVDGDSLIKLPDQCVDNGPGYSGLIDHIWGCGQIDPESIRTANKAILCPKNRETFKINADVLELIPGL